MWSRTIVIFACMLICLNTWAAKPRNNYIQIRTDYGVCIVKLYNETPLHRDNFIKLVKDDFYNGLLFHRIIEGFMIQGGDPSSKDAEKDSILGSGSLDYTIPAEFNDSLFHKKGALAAARDNNPEKASSASQFYIIQGETFTDEELDRIETVRFDGKKIPAYQREIYKELGGTPYLDQNYTVFGEVVDGIGIVDQLAEVATDRYDRPVVDQKMEITLLRRGEVRRLERKLRKAEE